MSFKILVAVDGSDSALRAALWLARREARRDSEITIWTTFEPVGLAPFVWDTGPVGMSAGADQSLIEQSLRPTEEERAGAEKLIDGAVARMAEEGVHRGRIKKHVQGRVLGQDVASLILHAYHEGRFDEVVIGRRGLGRFKEWLLGSVSNRIVHHLADGAVTVVG